MGARTIVPHAFAALTSNRAAKWSTSSLQNAKIAPSDSLSSFSIRGFEETESLRNVLVSCYGSIPSYAQLLLSIR